MAISGTTGDIGEATLNAAEVKALSSGNPLLLELALAEQELARLVRLERSHATTQRTLATTVTHSERGIVATRQHIAELEALQHRSQPTAGDQFRLTLTSNGHVYTDRADAAAALNRVLRYPDSDPQAVCALGGHTIIARSRTAYTRDGGRRYETVWRLEGGGDVSLTTTRDSLRDGHVDLGTIRRFENLITGIPAQISRSQRHVADLEHTLDQAQRMVGKPFPHAEQVAAARARYTELTDRIADQQQPVAQEAVWEAVTSPARPVDRIERDRRQPPRPEVSPPAAN